MKRFAKILVRMTLQNDDAGVLRWASRVAALAEAREIHLVHVWRPVDIPPGLRAKYPWLLEPGEKLAQERMLALAEAHLPPSSRDIARPRIISGPSDLPVLLHLSRHEWVDIVLTGKEDRGVAAEKLARKAPCSVMAVPCESVDSSFRKVLVPVDFSPYSAGALNVARAFALAAGLRRLTCMHAWSLPYGYQKTSLPKDDFARDLEETHRRQLEAFVLGEDLAGLQPDFLTVQNPIPANAVKSAIAAGGYDLVMVGCRGKDALAAALLGSNAGEILRTCPVPVVAVKEKGTGLNILDRLLEN